MNKILFTLLHIIFVVYGNPVKRDGVSYKLTSGEFKSFDEIPVMIIKLIPSSESTSEDLEHEIPIEFPFQIARSIDEILNFNRNSLKTEKPSNEDTATCPNTDIVFNTEASTQDTNKFENLNSILNKRKQRDDKTFTNVNKADQSVSEASVSMSNSESSISSDRKMLKELSKHRKQNMEKVFENNKKIIQNEISRSSKENENLFEETFILEKVNGEPVKETLTIAKMDDTVVQELGLASKDGTEEEIENLETISKSEESLVPFNSRILDILMNPFRIF
ncbi:unnamed protein product [Chironomus riparius]|uniref:Uncharacterized protein n=1 Tax=Chironomus riparius TaxID=315576 RepID=A0A9N9WP85_9DIPT|nr:unnamed protein product [Chironomus riparius]